MRTEIHLRYANGYRILEMFEDAESELSKIPPEDRLSDRSLAMQATLFQDCGKWGEMREVADALRKRHPEEVDWWIAEAYATRRCRSIEEAREILLEGVKAHPEEPCISYNLGLLRLRVGRARRSSRASANCNRARSHLQEHGVG